MITQPCTAAYFPREIILHNLESGLQRDMENAHDLRMLKYHELRDTTCNIEHFNILIEALADFVTEARFVSELEEKISEALDYVFLDFTSRYARKDPTLDLLQTIYASLGNDEEHTYDSPAEGAFENFRQALGFFLTSQGEIAFARLLLGMRYLLDIDGFDAEVIAEYFNQRPAFWQTQGFGAG